MLVGESAYISLYMEREKMCRHITRVRVGQAVLYRGQRSWTSQLYYIVDGGVQCRIEDNRWRWWSTANGKTDVTPEDRTLNGARAFVCACCTNKRYGKNRWLMTADLGRFPPGLEQLGFLEQILMARFVCFGRINKMGCITTQTESGSKISRLHGHMLALPLSNAQVIESECNELPMKKFAKYATRICFIGDGKAERASRELTLQHDIYQIDTEKLKRWMMFMGQDNELRRFVEHEDLRVGGQGPGER